MRPLETLFLLALALYVSWTLLRKRPPTDWTVPLILMLGLAHGWLEGTRWQLWPAYLVALAIAGAVVWQRRAPSGGHRVPMRVMSSAGLALVALSAALAWALPVVTLPPPSGPYPIGTVTYHWIDPTRPERYTDDPADVREIMVQIWYPAAPDPAATPAPWQPQADLFAPAVARFLGLPSFALDHLALLRTHAYADAPLADGGPFPVVLYSHGWTGFRTINVDQMEALASHGYIAVAPDHTYGALLTIFPDGRLAPNKPDILPEGVPDEVYDRAANQLVETYAADLRFTLDQLDHLNADDGATGDTRFAGRLDLTRTGLFGHSTGGGAVVTACHADPRCKALLGQDAWVEPVDEAIIADGLRQPALFMRSEPWTRNDNDARLSRLYDDSTGPRYRLGIAGTRHRDFTLQPLLSPLTGLLGLSGSLDGARGLGIVEAYVVAFFDATLKGDPSPLLAGPNPAYPEVTFERTPARPD